MPSLQAPFFSIIIPTYNYGQYVGLAIESALAQRNETFEVLVIDDGSTDDTSRVVQPYLNRVGYIRRENAGAAAARNHGADLANGQFLVFLDSDDRLLPDALSHFRECLAAHPEARMVIGHHFSVGVQGKRHEARRQPKLGTQLASFRDFIRGKFRIVQGAFAVHRGVFQKVRYPQGITHREDTVFLARTLLFFPCRTFRHAVVEVQSHSGRMRDNVEAMQNTMLKTVEAIFQGEDFPHEAQRCRGTYAAKTYLSLAHSLHKAKRYRAARKFYARTVSTDWTRALHPRTSARFLSCAVRSLFN